MDENGFELYSYTGSGTRLTLQHRRLSSRSSNGRFLSGEVRTSRRGCSGLAGQHRVCLGKLPSFKSGGDSEASSNNERIAHIEFSSTEEALRAARKGAPHGFSYANRLLDVDFVPWLSNIGPFYRVRYISGWPTTQTRPELLQLHRLGGCKGPRGEALRAPLSCCPVLPLRRLWGCVYADEEMLWCGEEAHFEQEWAGLGFGWTRRNPGPDASAASQLRRLWGCAGIGVRDDEALEGAMRTVAEEVRSADPDVQRSLPLSPGTHGLEAECLGASSSDRPQKEDRRERKSREDVKMI
ncbi:hypothetical protein V8E53_000483 [Lactarius tabidus]